VSSFWVTQVPGLRFRGDAIPSSDAGMTHLVSRRKAVLLERMTQVTQVTYFLIKGERGSLAEDIRTWVNYAPTPPATIWGQAGGHVPLRKSRPGLVFFDLSHPLEGHPPAPRGTGGFA
jgi:hypothetical protein